MNQIIKVWDYLEELQVEKEDILKIVEKVLFPVDLYSVKV